MPNLQLGNNKYISDIIVVDNNNTKKSIDYVLTNNTVCYQKLTCDNYTNGYYFRDYNKAAGNANILTIPPKFNDGVNGTKNIIGLKGDLKYSDNPSLQKIYLPNTITYIKMYLKNYRNIMDVYFDGNLSDWCGISEHSDSFNGNLYLKDSNNNYVLYDTLYVGLGGSTPNASVIRDYSFADNKNFKNIIFAGGAIIDTNAFTFSNIETLTIPYQSGPSTIDFILPSGFKKFVNYSSNVTNLNGGIFSNCRNFINYKTNSNHNITKIGDYTFENTALSQNSINTLMSKITSLGYRAFENTGVSYISSLRSYISHPFILSLKGHITGGDYAFVNSAIGKLNFNLESKIASSMFKNSGLCRLDMPNRLNTYIDLTEAISSFNGAGLVTANIGLDPLANLKSAFYGCYYLSFVRLDNSCTTGSAATGINRCVISENMFSQCDSLFNLFIPNSKFKSIEDYAFEGSALKAIYIPTEITNIGYMAFANLQNNLKIYYQGSQQQWNAITKGNYWDSDSNITVYYNCSNYNFKSKGIFIRGQHQSFTTNYSDSSVTIPLGAGTGQIPPADNSQTVSISGTMSSSDGISYTFTDIGIPIVEDDIETDDYLRLLDFTNNVQTERYQKTLKLYGYACKDASNPVQPTSPLYSVKLKLKCYEEIWDLENNMITYESGTVTSLSCKAWYIG